MKIGDRVRTPRFCTVTIKEIFENRKQATAAGYTEPTHYDFENTDGWNVAGKSIDENHMIFAAYKI